MVYSFFGCSILFVGKLNTIRFGKFKLVYRFFENKKVKWKKKLLNRIS